MSTPKLHQTKTGPNSGKWVPCNAQQQCRNGGIHATAGQIKSAVYLYEEKTGIVVNQSDIPIQAVNDYLRADLDTKERIDGIASGRLPKNQWGKPGIGRGAVVKTMPMRETLEKNAARTSGADAGVIAAEQADTTSPNYLRDQQEFPDMSTEHVAREPYGPGNPNRAWEETYTGPGDGNTPALEGEEEISVVRRIRKTLTGSYYTRSEINRAKADASAEKLEAKSWKGVRERPTDKFVLESSEDKVVDYLLRKNLRKNSEK